MLEQNVPVLQLKYKMQIRDENVQGKSRPSYVAVVVLQLKVPNMGNSKKCGCLPPPFDACPINVEPYFGRNSGLFQNLVGQFKVVINFGLEVLGHMQ